VFPGTVEGLKELPGIGDYTSAAITAIAFDKPATVVDGNVERVIARWFRIEEPLPAGKKLIRQYAGYLSDGRTDRPGDFAQAMMDLGATVCTPQSPRCGFCPVAAGCEARKAGAAEKLPARAAKAAKPYKYGHVYWITDKKGRVLFERRPDKGLLAATIGLPTSDWDEGRADHAPFAAAALKGSPAVKDHKIFHSFTHFDLELQGWLLATDSSGAFDSERYFWVDGGNVAELGLPSLFKKFAKIMVHWKQ
jgi:A/G-specific adenine glycosylase